MNNSHRLHFFFCIFAAGILPLAALSSASATVTQVYSNDFEAPVGSEWSQTDRDVTPVGARGFLGQFGSESAVLSLSGLPAHDSVTVSFDVYVIDSWDGQGIDVGPDIFDLSVVGGATLLHTTFSNVENCAPGDRNQAYPGTYPGASNLPRTGAIENNTLGYHYLYGHCTGTLDAGDSVYHISTTVSHTANSLALNFSASLFGLPDEFWGLDNVTVSVTQSVLDTDNDGLGDDDERNIHGTRPRRFDSDGDGYNDGQEVNLGTNPLDATSRPRLPRGLAAWWRMNEGTGTITSDSSGNGHTGILSGTPLPSWIRGVSSNGLQFANNASHVAIPGSLAGVIPGAGSLIISNRITMSAWVKVASGEDGIILARSGPSGSIDGSYMLAVSLGKASMSLFLNGAYKPLTGSTLVPDDGQWHLITGVYDGAEMRVYLDSVLDTSQAATGTIDVIAADTFLGRLSDGGFPFIGSMDDVRIYNRALSVNEITQLYRTRGR